MNALQTAAAAAPLPNLDALLSDARARQHEIERARCLPQDLADGLARAGVFRMLVPTCHAGLEVHPSTMVRTLRDLARADGATGWVGMIGATTGSLSASVSEDWAQQIWNHQPDVITCGVTAPLGRARRVDGGFEVSGRWPFGSASANARWICGGATIVGDDGEPATDDAGRPELRLMLFDAQDVQMHDTWHVSGLCGTGSGDIAVDGVFVPEGRSTRLGNRPRVRTPLFRFPTFGLLALGVASVSLGIAEHALEAFIDLAGGKKPSGSRRTLAQRGAAQAEAARARAALRAAESYMHASIDDAWRAAEAGEALTLEHRADLRLAAVHAAQASAEAVDRCYHAAGGSAIYETSALQQCFRDVHVTTQHIMVGQPVWELTGRVTLGLDPGGPL